MLLEINNLSVEYYRRAKIIPALRNVSLNLESGKTLGIVGESGCGKSTLALTILRLILQHEGRITNGEIIFNGLNLLTLSEQEMRAVRGKEISIVFQDPFSSLNPVIKIGDQIAESILAHSPDKNKQGLQVEVIKLLKDVRLPEPERIIHSYPHQISGGQRQRVMIAIAISNHPKLLIADEPTTSLDVTVQKEILELLNDLQKVLNMSIILITHHMGIIANYTEKLNVLYAGEIVEEGNTAEVIKNPQHPYTRALLQTLNPPSESSLLHTPSSRTPLSRGDKGGSKKKEDSRKFYMIPGNPPDLSELPSGCIFHTRCPVKVSECEIKNPALRTLVSLNRKVSCHLAPFALNSHEPTGNK